MATVVLSGRVDERVVAQASKVLRAAGLTPAALIRRVWEGIAATGSLPEVVIADGRADPKREAFDRFVAFAEGLPACSEELASADNAEVRRMVAMAHASAAV